MTPWLNPEQYDRRRLLRNVLVAYCACIVLGFSAGSRWGFVGVVEATAVGLGITWLAVRASRVDAS